MLYIQFSNCMTKLFLNYFTVLTFFYFPFAAAFLVRSRSLCKKIFPVFTLLVFHHLAKKRALVDKESKPSSIEDKVKKQILVPHHSF